MSTRRSTKQVIQDLFQNEAVDYRQELKASLMMLSQEIAHLRSLAHLESAPEVQPHRHQPRNSDYLTSLPIPEPREETPQSGHISPESSSASPEETTESTPAMDIGALISSIWERGPASAEAVIQAVHRQKNRTTAPISSTRAEEASRGRSVSIGEANQRWWLKQHDGHYGTFFGPANDMNHGYNIMFHDNCGRGMAEQHVIFLNSLSQKQAGQ
jgi:hypothetical protein